MDSLLAELYLNLENDRLVAREVMALRAEKAYERTASGDQIGQLPSLRYGQLVGGNLRELARLEDW
jgi:hypothetical protein